MNEMNFNKSLEEMNILMDIKSQIDRLHNIKYCQSKGYDKEVQAGLDLAITGLENIYNILNK